MRRLVLGVLVLAVVALLAGCGGTTQGTITGKTEEAPPSATRVTVAQVANDPAAWDGKTVTTEGNYAVGYCSACFLLKDGVSALRVEVSDTAPLPPESKLNSRMEVTGRIYVAKGSPNLVATSLVYK
ncbi:MAG: hypothetical protein KKF41_10865 [Actinobacteria bacterium]|nr:hypothetical protein [Actinomycetota bacterium]MBU1944870.1 hypothetical protein [Actinomycetota bacterium]MBU2688074.1 hypothetical protein [Actinomycetota bacterium]